MPHSHPMEEITLCLYSPSEFPVIYLTSYSKLLVCCASLEAWLQLSDSHVQICVSVRLWRDLRGETLQKSLCARTD